MSENLMYMYICVVQVAYQLRSGAKVAMTLSTEVAACTAVVFLEKDC